jgi:hypothetical protein
MSYLEERFGSILVEMDSVLSFFVAMCDSIQYTPTSRQSLARPIIWKLRLLRFDQSSAWQPCLDSLEDLTNRTGFREQEVLIFVDRAILLVCLAP